MGELMAAGGFMDMEYTGRLVVIKSGGPWADGLPQK